MKKFLYYSFIIIVIFSLQSCVSNYMVTAPAMQKVHTENEDKALVAKLEEAKKTHTEEVKIVKEDNTKILASIEKEIKKSNTIDQILNEASTYIGTPYRFGGMTRSGIDCSAFVLSVYGSATGINLPRISSAQAQEGERVEREELEKGDLLFFQTRGSRISHVGIVQEITPEGEIKFIHASTSKGVTISSLNEKYWGLRFRFAKRILTNEKIQEMASL